jgi:signal transduction histidine kinase
MDLILFINILCTGIVFSCSVIIMTFGSKVLNTRIHGFFWFVIFLYLLTNNLESSFIFLKGLNFSHFIQFFIPSFYAMYILIKFNIKNKFFKILIFVVPLVSIIIWKKDIFIIFYHLIFWITLMVLSMIYKNKSVGNSAADNKEILKFNIFSTLFTLLSVFPFIIINLLVFLLFKKENIFELILPPCLALSSMLILLFSYKSSLLELDHNYYANIDLLKKSIANEKKTIVEKIASGLLHEIKNPLTAVGSINQMLLEYYPALGEEKIKEYLNVIADEIGKTKKLTNSFLTSFRKGNDFPVNEFLLNDLFSAINDLLKFDLTKNAIILNIKNGLLMKNVTFNFYKLREVFINLLYNSIEAKAKNIEIFSEEDEKYFNIYFKDDGEGINENNQKNLFTSFFTTKLEGCGLGLVISRDIMHEYSGNLKLISSVKNETVFCVSLKK